MNKLNLKRPKRLNEETEDDLLAFQENFLKNKTNEQPAAKCVKQQATKPDLKETKKNDKTQEMEFESDDKALALVLSEIVEKQIDLESIKNTQVPVSNVPKIEKIDFKSLSENTEPGKGGTKKKSLFAKNLERQGKLKSFYNLENIQQTNQLAQNERLKQIEKQIIQSKHDSNKQLPQNSGAYEKRKQIITGEGISSHKDAEQIHLENLQRLSQMNPDEIEEAQQRVIQQLDPKMVAFIRQKKFNEKSLVTEVTDPTSIENKLSADDKKEFIDQLPIKPDKKWLHMDKIEYDKLEWMTKRQGSQNEDQTGSAARFNFNGELMERGKDVPVTQALHHHGEEPDSAGYTLAELFHLSRSNFDQQRVIALQSIGNILTKCHSGYYYESIKSGVGAQEENEDSKNVDRHNLLNQLVDGGVLFLLRWSLDDQTESIINAALTGIKNLVQPGEQEKVLDLTFDLFKGHEVLSLQPTADSFGDLKNDSSNQNFKLGKDLTVDEKKDLDELTDEEYIKYDLIKGLFRMNLIARLFYLLNAYKPSYTATPMVNNIFAILYRCVRHSPQITHELLEKYPTFIDLIAEKFLPKFIDLTDQNQIKNAELVLKLFRLMGSAGVYLATKLFEKYKLDTCLVNYLTILNPSTVRLQTEAIRLVKTLNFLIHEKATGLVDFQIMLQNIKNVTHSLSGHINEDNVQYLQGVISLFSLIGTDDQNVREMCAGVFSVVQTFLLTKLKFYLSSDDQVSLSTDLNLMSVCLNYIVDYLEKTAAFDKKIDHIDYLIKEFLQPLIDNDVNILKLNSLVMSKLVRNSTSTTEETDLQSFSRIRGNNLSYLPTMLNFCDAEGRVTRNMIDRIAPFCFMSGFMRLYLVCFKFRIKLFENGAYASTHKFLDNEYLRSYLRTFKENIGQGVEAFNNCFLIMRYENYFVYYCLKLAFTLFNFEDIDSKKLEKIEEIPASESTAQKKLFYLTSLSLILKLKSGDEYFIHDTLTTCTFNMNIWTSFINKTNVDNFLINYFEKLNLNNQTETAEFSYLNTNIGQAEVVKVNATVIKSLEMLIFENLNQIKISYLGTIINNKLLEHSRRLNVVPNVTTQNQNKLGTLFLSSDYSNHFLLKPDWIYGPIKFYGDLIKSMPSDAVLASGVNATKIISSVSNALKFIYLLEIYCSDFVERTLDITLRYVHLLHVYLFESEVFLDKQVVTYLYLILLRYSKDRRSPLEHLNLGMKLPGIISFYDFYKHLLAHYDSTSFGDDLFSQFLLLPLQQRSSAKYRQLFWSEYFHLFKYIRLEAMPKQLMVPVKNFLVPCEKSLNMIRQYSQIMLDQADSELAGQSRLAYAILVAHLNSYIFEHTSEIDNKLEFDFKKLLVQKFLALKNEKLKHDLIYYKSMNELDQTQQFHKELPNLRKNWLHKLQS